jgi:hypothetical protein
MPAIAKPKAPRPLKNGDGIAAGVVPNRFALGAKGRSIPVPTATVNMSDQKGDGSRRGRPAPHGRTELDRCWPRVWHHRHLTTSRRELLERVNFRRDQLVSRIGVSVGVN